MRHRFGLIGDVVSLKGMMKLERVVSDASRRSQCIEAATKRITETCPVDSAWLALQVSPGREHAVEIDLESNEIEAAVPVCMGPQRRRHHKVLPPSPKPVFIGYTFVRCIPSGYALQALMGFEHVLGVVGGWAAPHRLTCEAINYFKEMAASGAYDWEVKRDALPKGCKVLVKEGPFASFEGIVVAFGGAGKGTPVIELDIFGRKTPILIPLAMLQRL